MKNIVVKAAFAAVVVLPVSALAHPVEGDAPHKEVHYSGLDLGSKDGVAMLNTRVARAVQAVCGRSGTLTLAERMAVRKCETEAKKSSASQVEVAIAKVRTERYAGDPAKVAVNTVTPKGF